MEKESDIIILAPLRGTDITRIRLKKEANVVVLTRPERNAQDYSFMAHFYGMLDLQLYIGGRATTLEEWDHLHARYPLNTHAEQLVELGQGQRLPEDEDVSVPQ